MLLFKFCLVHSYCLQGRYSVHGFRVFVFHWVILECREYCLCFFLLKSSNCFRVKAHFSKISWSFGHLLVMLGRWLWACTWRPSKHQWLCHEQPILQKNLTCQDLHSKFWSCIFWTIFIWLLFFKFCLACFYCLQGRPSVKGFRVLVFQWIF